MYLRIICTKAEHLLYESCYSDESTAMRVSDAGPSVHVEKLALMALYPLGRSVFARVMHITRTIVKLVASVSFSKTRRKMTISVLAGRYFIRRDTFTIVWKRSPVIITWATSSWHYPFVKTNFVTRASFFLSSLCNPSGLPI